jgi:hypothetical protein
VNAPAKARPVAHRSAAVPAHGPSTVSAHGQSVQVALASGGHSATFAVVEGDSSTVLLRPEDRRGEQLLDRLPVGSSVVCVSSAGWWPTRVRTAPQSMLRLAQPPWLGRSARRKHVRVPLQPRVAMVMQVDGTTWAGQLCDLSLTGAAIALERLAPLTAGSSLRVRLPQGEAQAVVRSRRPHGHPLLMVIGVEWTGVDDRATAWVQRAVGREVDKIGAPGRPPASPAPATRPRPPWPPRTAA